MGQQIGLRKRFIVFRPNSIVSAFDMAFFSKFSFRWSFFFSTPEFSLRQISATFRLEIGQWEGLPWRIIVFQQNSIVSVSEIAFQKIFHFGARFFCAKIQFRLNWCNFSIEIGQQIGLRKRFIVFWPNSIVSASEMAFFSNVLFRWWFFFLQNSV